MKLTTEISSNFIEWKILATARKVQERHLVVWPRACDSSLYDGNINHSFRRHRNPHCDDPEGDQGTGEWELRSMASGTLNLLSRPQTWTPENVHTIRSGLSPEFTFPIRRTRQEIFCSQQQHNMTLPGVLTGRRNSRESPEPLFWIFAFSHRAPSENVRRSSGVQCMSGVMQVYYIHILPVFSVHLVVSVQVEYVLCCLFIPGQ